jgi:exopolysaccharide production protein ExoZ
MYVTVQYLRAAAALSVLLFHVLAYYSSSRGYYPFVFASGVDLFFVISGFIMVATTRKGFDPAAFAWARFWRVVPYWWLMLFAYIALRYVLTDQLPQAGTVVKSALLIPHFSESSHEPVPILGPGWSLTNELVFYFIFGLTLACCVGRPLRHLGLMFAAFAALVALRVFAAPDSAVGIRLTSPLFFEFLLGAAVAYYLAPITRHLKRCRLALVLGGLAILAVMNPLYFREGLPRVVVFGLPYMLVLAGLLLYEAEARRYELALLRKIGDASYSLYLTHMLVIVALERSGMFAVLPPALAIAAGIVIAVWVALLAYARLEKPLLEAGRRPRAQPMVRPA